MFIFNKQNTSGETWDATNFLSYHNIMAVGCLENVETWVQPSCYTKITNSTKKKSRYSQSQISTMTRKLKMAHRFHSRQMESHQLTWVRDRSRVQALDQLRTTVDERTIWSDGRSDSWASDLEIDGGDHLCSSKFAAHDPSWCTTAICFCTCMKAPTLSGATSASLSEYLC